MRPALPLLLLIVAPLTGCASDTASYPSLAPRAAEKQDFSEPEAPPAPVATPDTALDRQLAIMTDALAAAGSGFDEAATRAASAVAAARGDRVGGDRWIEAQTRLAELDDYRALTSETVTELESLAIARAGELQPDYPALETARAQGQAQLDRQTQRIAELQKVLPAA